MRKNTPVIGEKYYFMHKKVTVIAVWDYFHLAKINVNTMDQDFYVDFCTLTKEPDLSNSISLRLLRRESIEHPTIY